MSINITQADLITLGDLRTAIAADSTYGIYVLNTASVPVNDASYDGVGVSSPFSSRSIEAAVNINIGTGKEPVLLNIPPLWIPLDLTARGDSQDILKSSSFKECIERRTLTLISRDAFNRMMSSSDAREAYAHYLSSVSNTNAAANDSDLLKQVNAKINKQGIKTATAAKTKAETLSHIVEKFVSVSSDTNHNQLYQEYKSVEPKLSLLDLTHLSEKAAVTKIKNDAAKKVAKAAGN